MEDRTTIARNKITTVDHGTVWRIVILTESLLDCDIVVDDRRADLDAALEQRDRVAMELASIVHQAAA